MAWPARSLRVLEATLLDQEATCPNCGTREDEWGTFDASGRLVPYRRTPFEATLHECPGCRLRDGTAAGESDLKPGQRWVLRRPKGPPLREA